MYLSTSTALLAISIFLLPFASAGPAKAYPPNYGYPGGYNLGGSKGCSYTKKRAMVQAELDTISSHSFGDAARINLATDATRTFYVTPNEAPEVTLKINVGFSADTVQTELVLLATALDAGVPPSSVHFINNANGTVTSDFVQTDRIVLPYVHVREVHYFNDACEISQIIGWVHGNIVCPVDPSELVNSVLLTICNELAGLGLIGKLQPVINGS